jgi:sugar phosphate isomerase/epimerase
LTRTSRRRFLTQSAAAAASSFLCSSLKTSFGATAGPNLQFPSAPRDRLAIASYPFRDFIAGTHDSSRDSSAPGMDLKNFLPHVQSKFNINKIEPWSEHFRSLDAQYLAELRSTIEVAHGAIVNIAVDGGHSPFALDKSERDEAVAFSKRWIDAALAVGSPSVRTNMPPAKDSQPDVDRAVDSLSRVADYGASKNILVNLENDNPASEDPFFIVQVLEKVNNPYLHSNPDFANSLMTGKTEYAYKGIEALFAHAYGICHVKAMEADEKGRLVRVDMPRTFAILKRSHYRGYCSMEFDSPGDPYQGTSDLIAQTLEYLS